MECMPQADGRKQRSYSMARRCNWCFPLVQAEDKIDRLLRTFQIVPRSLEAPVELCRMSLITAAFYHNDLPRLPRSYRVIGEGVSLYIDSSSREMQGRWWGKVKTQVFSASHLKRITSVHHTHDMSLGVLVILYHSPSGQER